MTFFVPEANTWWSAVIEGLQDLHAFIRKKNETKNFKFDVTPIAKRTFSLRLAIRKASNYQIWTFF